MKCQYRFQYSYVFSSSHVRMWELDHKEGWEPKNWCFQTVVLEKTLESPLDCKAIKPVNNKGNKPWVFIGRIDAEAQTQYISHLMQRVNSLEKTLMLGKIEGRRRRRHWMVSLTQQTWVRWARTWAVWARSRRLWRTEKTGVLQSMGLQRVRHNWVTEQQ